MSAQIWQSGKKRFYLTASCGAGLSSQGQEKVNKSKKSM